MIPAWRTHSPCGECRALVPKDVGCLHWKPGVSKTKTTRRGPNKAPTVAGFRKAARG